MMTRRHTRRPFAMFTALALVLIAASGCEPDFEEPQIVIDLRILSAKVEPPEVVFPIPTEAFVPPEGIDPTSGELPSAEDMTNLGTALDELGELLSQLSFGPFTQTWLFADPRHPDEELPYVAYLCVLDDNSRCGEETDRVVIAEGTAAPGEISYEVMVTGDQLLAAQQADMYFGYFGVPVWTEIIIGEGDDAVHAIKSIIVSFKGEGFAPDREANENPVIDQIEDVTAMEDVQVVQKAGPPIPLDGTWTVTTGEEVLLLVVPTDESRQTFYMPTFQGTQIEDEEKLEYYFLSDKGRFSRYSRNEQDFRQLISEVPEDYVKDVSSKWTAPSEPGTVTMWLIAIDGRGGTDWRMFTVEVVDE